MISRYKSKASVRDLCKWADVPVSSFYYKDHPGPRGMTPSTHTRCGQTLVSNDAVLDQIRSILSTDYCVYGYMAMMDIPLKQTPLLRLKLCIVRNSDLYICADNSNLKSQ